MKDINYKMKYLNRVVSSKRKSLRPAFFQNRSCVYQKSVKYDKNQIDFFCEKLVSKSVRSYRIL